VDALEFVQGSEYRKQIARELAKRVAQGITVEEILADPATYGDDLLGGLLNLLRTQVIDAAAEAARLHAADLGLYVVDSGEIAALVDETLSTVIQEAVSNLDNAIQSVARAIGRMQDTGVAEDVIAAALGTDTGSGALLAPVVSVLTQSGAGMVNSVEKAVLQASVTATDLLATQQGADEPQLFEWETREDDKVCEDVFENSCAPRHGEQLTSDEWDAFGAPGSENLVCTIYAKGAFSNCRCVLRAANSAGRSPAPINTAEAAAAGKEQALRELEAA